MPEESSVSGASTSQGDAFNSSTTSDSNSLSAKEDNSIHIADQEDKYVTRMKKVVHVSLFLSTVALALLTYFLTSKEEQEDFENHFYDFAIEVMEVAGHEIHNVYSVMEALSITTTSIALFKNVTWPLFSLPHFESRVSEARVMAKADSIILSPLVKTEEARVAWQTYAYQNDGWIDEGLTRQKQGSVGDPEIPFFLHSDIHDQPIPMFTPGPFSPIWQVSHAPQDRSIVNFDLFQNEVFRRLEEYCDYYREPALSEAMNMEEIFGYEYANKEHHPESLFVMPIYDNFRKSSDIVGHYIAVIGWDKYFENILHEGANGIYVVLSDSCGDAFTYQIFGEEARYLGEGDLHEHKYDHMKLEDEFANFAERHETLHDADHCEYMITLYPSAIFEDDFHTSGPAIYTAVVILICICTTMVFVLYDFLVTRRQNKVVGTAVRTQQIVGSMFPAAVRDQLLKEQENAEEQKGDKNLSRASMGKAGLKNFLTEYGDAECADTDSSKPIADLFPNTTVMYTDICGFTAWSSVREPNQVFILLETIYHEFDELARKRKVFKVETVGDSYVAVAGLPEPRKEHAVIMARFARDCIIRMKETTAKLELTLGPDTGDLGLRVGLHSGPVTAGVLRGDRARFQLFGDTMNVASRMETTGLRNRVQISQETADLLIQADKKNWLEQRKDAVVSDGKGVSNTFWLRTEPKKVSASPSVETGITEPAETSETFEVDQKQDELGTQAVQQARKAEKLVDWNTELLIRLLKMVVARRNATEWKEEVNNEKLVKVKELESVLGERGTAIDEIVEIIKLPKFDGQNVSEVDTDCIDMGKDVEKELRNYVSVLASMYRDNPFHCFEHASHVTMSVNKLLSRIIAPDVADSRIDEENADNIASSLHDNTYGITSDPLTHFTVVLSGLMHDVDHRGIPNFVLEKEDPSLATVYKSKSVAEQNSIDLAWGALQDPSFENLRKCIYRDETELNRFRQLIVNSIMATDIFDKDLAVLRKRRWQKAFHEEQVDDSADEKINRKATIVLEHLIQASDVSHTMQHWEVYRKWNARLFKEMYMAYKHGRTDKNPADSWYKGELGFFDNYIVPLTQKLKECGVFGVSSDEYLNYALDNRREWEKKGEEIVRNLLEELSSEESERLV